jgi:hypothetical protein
VPPIQPTDVASEAQRRNGAARLSDTLSGAWPCSLNPEIPLAEGIQLSPIGLEGCPQVPEVIGLEEDDVVARLVEWGWDHRTLYRDTPLDWEDNILINRISLFVVDGVIVDARWA